MDRTAAIAWSAGLFEGEGTVIYGASHKGPLRVKISSTDRDVLDLLVIRTGYGAVYGPYPPNGFGKKDFFEWVVNGHKAVAFLQQILPFLGVRRTERILEKIALWNTRPVRRILDKDSMHADRATGMSYSALGAKYGISLARAFQICRDGKTAPRRKTITPTA